ncbi:hypothetical protein XBJ1_2885 [Xenorhabdus bovienii SS-2004]|uniref:Uncharacterized protein n=1 Tax=Xenorhabdus bovienii (strain SS-2004) TaxID=406818 RepID=D3V847_XENBS|nr:hypothetical protein XBJ1_2885 [Xenorhabdus bovienii SS-2004]
MTPTPTTTDTVYSSGWNLSMMMKIDFKLSVVVLFSSSDKQSSLGIFLLLDRDNTTINQVVILTETIQF